MSVTLGPQPKVLRIIALERVCIQFPYREDIQGSPADVVLSRGEFYDLNEDDLEELSDTIDNLLANGSITTVQIGYYHNADALGYYTGSGFISIQSEIEIILGMIGGAPPNTGKLAEVSGNTVLNSSQNYVIVNSPTDCIITLPLKSTVITTIGTDKFSNMFVIKNAGTTKVTVAGQGGDLIDGDPSALIVFQYESLSLIPSTVEWNII